MVRCATSRRLASFVITLMMDEGLTHYPVLTMSSAHVVRCATSRRLASFVITLIMDEGLTHYPVLTMSSAHGQVRNLTEIGVLRGHSLRMWHAYFPRATIWGIDRGANPYALKYVRNATRVRLRYGDSKDPKLPQRLRSAQVGGYEPLHTRD